MEEALLALLRAQDPRGADALLLHYGPLMRYVIAPILADPRDREECLSEAILRVWERTDQFDPQRGSWTAWLTALTRGEQTLFYRKCYYLQSTAQIAAELGLSTRAAEGRPYPVQSATENQMSGSWNWSGPFLTVQDALQFYPNEEGVRLINAE